MFAARYCSIGVFILLNLNVLCHGQRPQTISSATNLAFPENEEQNPDKQNSQKKTPVYVKDFCKVGEILYPGDQADDWVCDCKPAHIYHPDTQQCYPAYTRGPCQQGQYLVLARNQVLPECQRNPCAADQVPFQNSCYKLDTAGPCRMSAQISNVVGVNETTLEIICTKDYELNSVSVGTRSDAEFDDTTDSIAINPEGQQQICTLYNKNSCFKGGIRWTQSKCPIQT